MAASKIIMFLNIRCRETITITKLKISVLTKYINSSSVDSDRTAKNSLLIPSEMEKKHVGRLEGKTTNADQNAAKGMGESSIISNILSMDFDAWDESLTSPQNFAKLLSETDRQQGSLKLSSSWKVQNNSQSKFSFARQEESKNLESDVEPSLSTIGHFVEHLAYTPTRLKDLHNYNHTAHTNLTHSRHPRKHKYAHTHNSQCTY